jgi:secreted PhoX family phosphatase
MKFKPIALAVATALGVGALSTAVSSDRDRDRDHHDHDKRIQSVEFIGMQAPDTVKKKSDIYTTAKLKVTYKRGGTKIYDLKYHQLMGTTDTIKRKVVGGLFDVNGDPLTDEYGQMASDAADGTSLMVIPDMGSSYPKALGTLAMVTQFEYREVPPGWPGYYVEPYTSYWSKLPALISLSKLAQNKRTGALKVLDYDPIDFSGVNGGWIHCGSTLSAWNTHIGSEEYEPDAKTREGLPKASDSDDATDIDSFSQYYFGHPATANPYHYGWVPEVTVNKDGEASVVKHYAPGRFAREMQEMASDDRTAIGGDDGKNTGLFMFVADEEKDLSAGTIYAAKVTQTSAENGGSYTLEWIKLGHATDDEIQAIIDSSIKFSDVFDFLPADTTKDTTGYTKVTTYMGTEWLRLKEGMEQAAAFLETRRYAALLGATTEFSKMEYIAFNKKDRKFYLTISRVEARMADTEGDIQVARNDGGIILEMSTGKDQKDTKGKPIRSKFVGTKLTSIPELVGGWPIPEELDLDDGTDDGKDAEGNACEQDKLCGPDNLRYVDSIRTLFLGEDTSRRNNNYVWAFNIDTRKLSRILSVPMGAEATGLMIAPNYGGHAYIMSNFQHPGEGGLPNYLGTDKDRILAAIDKKWNFRKKVAVGYIGTKTGALPAFE